MTRSKAVSTPPPEALMDRLNYAFERPNLLEQALTHPSALDAQDNQRMEFLGDRVLGFCVAEALYARFPKENEGALSARLHRLVSKEVCAEIAASLDVGAHLRLGRSEALSGGRRKTALLGDAMEAVIAAIYLDGGMMSARDVILGLWAPIIEGQGRNAPRNAKNHIQEWAQGRAMAPPDYIEIARSGPDHAPIFVIEARLEDGRAAQGEGPGKRQAQQLAAEALLRLVGETGDE